MSEHLSDQTLDHYRQRMMPPAEMIAANDHLHTCDTCYQRFSTADQLEAAYTFVRANLQEVASTELDHPVYEQMAAYVDQTLSEKEIEILESHIELCAQCDIEMSDLRTLKDAFYSGEAPPEKKPPTWRERLAAFWQVPSYRMALQAASLLAIAALGGWLATIPLRARLADLQSQLSGLRQEKAQLQQEHQTAELAIAELKADLALSKIDSSSSSSQPIALTLNDGGGQVTLDKQGNLGGLNSLSPEYQQMVKTALTTKRVAAPLMIAHLKGESRQLMGSAGNEAAFTLLSPVGIVVPSERPLFRWTPLSGATGYVVTVYKPNAGEIASSPLLSASEWRAPTSLKPGDTYAWQVRALKNGEEIKMPAAGAPDAKFKILEPARAAELEHAKQTFAGSHLMLGLLYARAGLLDNAEQELRALSEANPRSGIAQKLLQSVNAMRRR